MKWNSSQNIEKLLLIKDSNEKTLKKLEDFQIEWNLFVKPKKDKLIQILINKKNFYYYPFHFILGRKLNSSAQKAHDEIQIPLEKEKKKLEIKYQWTEYKLNDINSEVRYLKFRIKDIDKKIFYIKKDIESAKRRKEKEERILGLAAQASKKTRQRAKSIKNSMSKSNACPYCDNLIEREHIDHIYPVAKGGLSTTKNMVSVCAECNLKKRDLTLNEFIRKFDLNRERIESNLDSLDKTY